MERGVIVGGLLISASFLLAMLFNRSAEDPAPAPAANAQADPPAVLAKAPPCDDAPEAPGEETGACDGSRGE